MDTNLSSEDHTETTTAELWRAKKIKNKCKCHVAFFFSEESRTAKNNMARLQNPERISYASVSVAHGFVLLEQNREISGIIIKANYNSHIAEVITSYATKMSKCYSSGVLFWRNK